MGRRKSRRRKKRELWLWNYNKPKKKKCLNHQENNRLESNKNSKSLTGNDKGAVKLQVVSEEGRRKKRREWKRKKRKEWERKG